MFGGGFLRPLHNEHVWLEDSTPASLRVDSPLIPASPPASSSVEDSASLTMSTAQTAHTQFTTAPNGVRYAYRIIGPVKGTPDSSNASPPLLMHIHYRANMDFWDPLLLNTLASHRQVIIFDQAGVGRSTGAIPTSYQLWASDLLAFVHALGLTAIDLAGFSMGGACVQQVALTAPELVRKLIVMGTSASQPGPDSDVSGIVWPREMPPDEPITVLSTGTSEESAFNGIAKSFFYDDEDGLAHAKAYWARVHERRVPGEDLMLTMVDEEGSKKQRLAYAEWREHVPSNSYDRLGELEMPVLVMNGDNDVLIPTSRSWELAARIPRAQLAIYPRAGHGFLYQFAELVGKHINLFLDGQGAGGAKL